MIGKLRPVTTGRLFWAGLFFFSNSRRGTMIQDFPTQTILSAGTLLTTNDAAYAGAEMQLHFPGFQPAPETDQPGEHCCLIATADLPVSPL